MTHRSEQILAAVKTRLTGLATTQGRVFRDRVHDLKEVPALSIEYINEARDSELSTDLADWWLHFSVDISVKSDNFTTTINKIRSEVTVALMADVTQGLSFVIDTEEEDLTAPEKSFDSEKPTATQVMPWKIMYRRNRSTPE